MAVSKSCESGSTNGVALPIDSKACVEQEALDGSIVDSLLCVIFGQVAGTDYRSSVGGIARGCQFAEPTDNARDKIGAIVEELRKNGIE